MESLMKARQSEIQEIMELQFVLSYMGNVSKEDSDDMSPYELKNWFNLLKKQRALEAETAKELNK